MSIIKKNNAIFLSLLKRIVHFSNSEVNQLLFCIELKYVKLRVITRAFANSGQIWYILEEYNNERETKKCPCLAKN